MKVEQRLKELDIELAEPIGPQANYVTTVQTGNLIFTSGHGPITSDGEILKSQLGTDATVEDGYASARLVALCLLSTLKHVLGDLDKVKRIVKVVGFVNSAPDFTDQPQSSMGHRIYSSKCSVIKADMPVLQSAWCNCPLEFLLKLRWLLKLRIFNY